jgi:hypothetical protein
VRTATPAGRWPGALWAFLCQWLLDAWRGLVSAVTWPRRKAAARAAREWAGLRAGAGTPRRGLGEDGADEPGEPCAHPGAVAVDLGEAGGGERVAWWCEECGTQLAADFTPPAPAVAGQRGGDPTALAARMINEALARSMTTGVAAQAVELYTQGLAAPAGYTVTGSWRRRHWHAGPEGCASCAGSDAAGARVCLCGRCAAAAAASVMG